MRSSFLYEEDSRRKAQHPVLIHEVQLSVRLWPSGEETMRECEG